jgi:hypothetical protein
VDDHIPANELEDNLSNVSFIRHPMLVGIVPWRHVNCIYIYRRLFSCPMVVGKAPLKLTLCISRLDKLDIEPMVLGIEPTKMHEWVEIHFRYINFDAVHIFKFSRIL